LLCHVNAQVYSLGDFKVISKILTNLIIEEGSNSFLPHFVLVPKMSFTPVATLATRKLGHTAVLASKIT